MSRRASRQQIERAKGEKERGTSDDESTRSIDMRCVHLVRQGTFRPVGIEAIEKLGPQVRYGWLPKVLAWVPTQDTQDDRIASSPTREVRKGKSRSR